MPESKPEESWLPVFPHLSKTIYNKIDNFFDIEDFLHLISDLPPPLLSQLAVVCPIVGQSSPCAFRAVPPSHQVSLSQSLFLTIWKIFFNVDMVDSVHLLLLQLQKSIVGPGSGASLVVLAKAPPLSWCWCKPSSGVSVSSPNQPVFPAGWCCGGTLQLLQRLSRPHNGLCSAPRICTRPGCTRDTMVHRSFRLGVPMHIDKDVQSGD